MQRLVLLCFLIMIFLSLPVFGHRVNVFCWWEADTLYGEGYFSGGKAAKNSKVEIYDSESNKLIATVTTDEEGKFSLPFDSPKEVKAVLIASMGHRAEYVALPQEVTEEKEVTSNDEINLGESVQIDYNRIEEIVDKKLHPVREEIIKLKTQYAHPNFSTILGGIGYIVGIFSLLYLLKKKNAS